MHVRRSGRPSAAFIMSAVALFISLGGTGYAAAALTLGKNSVGTKQLQNGAVTPAKIKPRDITFEVATV